MDDSLLILLRGLVYEVEELVEFGRDDDFGAAVALTAEVGGVCRLWGCTRRVRGGQA